MSAERISKLIILSPDKSSRGTQKETQSLLPRPVIMLAPPYLSAVDKRSSLQFHSRLGRHIALVEAIENEGFLVFTIGTDTDTEGAHDFYAFFSEIDKKKPDSLLPLPIEPNDDSIRAMEWPRDVFQVFDDLVCINQHHPDITTTLLKKLGVPQETIIMSDLAEGGLVVRAGKVLVLEMNHFLHHKDVALLKRRKYSVFYLPSGPRSSHIDTEFNLVQSQDGRFFAVVNEEYYQETKEEIDNILYRLSATLHIISDPKIQRRHPANFITLPNGKIVMPDSCGETQEFLEAAIGRENVLVVPVQPFLDLAADGGLRCKSNIIV